MWYCYRLRFAFGIIAASLGKLLSNLFKHAHIYELMRYSGIVKHSEQSTVVITLAISLLICPSAWREGHKGMEQITATHLKNASEDRKCYYIILGQNIHHSFHLRTRVRVPVWKINTQKDFLPGEICFKTVSEVQSQIKNVAKLIYLGKSWLFCLVYLVFCKQENIIKISTFSLSVEWMEWRKKNVLGKKGYE